MPQAAPDPAPADGRYSLRLASIYLGVDRSTVRRWRGELAADGEPILRPARAWWTKAELDAAAARVPPRRAKGRRQRAGGRDTSPVAPPAAAAAPPGAPQGAPSSPTAPPEDPLRLDLPETPEPAPDTPEPAPPAPPLLEAPAAPTLFHGWAW